MKNWCLPDLFVLPVLLAPYNARWAWKGKALDYVFVNEPAGSGGVFPYRLAHLPSVNPSRGR